MASTARALALIGLATAWLAGCSTAPPSTEAKDELFKKAGAERQEWNKLDPQMEAFARKGYGFAFFPEVTKGGLGVGGAWGRGVVYEQGQHVGYADITQASLGLQAGGQTYGELIVFENKAAMDRFKEHQFDLGANMSAVLATTGAAANARFVDGVAVFVRPIAGAMAEMSLSGQRITYVPK
jgi:lipid-binding SYLF domain-containing protein